MEAFITWFTKNLLALWPVARIYSWEQGIRVRGGIVVGGLLGPGLHWRWWFMDQVYQMAVTDRTTDILTPALVLQDGKVIVVSGNIVWRITDVGRMWRRVNEVEKSLPNLALGVLATILAGYTWADLSGARRAIQTTIAQQMSAETHDWGIEIAAVWLTDLAPAKVLRLVDGRD